jgi:hypothetical protein
MFKIFFFDFLTRIFFVFLWGLKITKRIVLFLRVDLEGFFGWGKKTGVTPGFQMFTKESI